MARLVKKKVTHFGFRLDILQVDKNGNKTWIDRGLFHTKHLAQEYAKRHANGAKVHIHGVKLDATPIDGGGRTSENEGPKA